LALRAITGRYDSLSPDESGGESEIAVGVSVFAPFYESEQLGSHANGFLPHRRNRSAPCALSL